MKKEYTYENAIVQIQTTSNTTRIRKSTEAFLKKVLMEEHNNGYRDQTGIVKEK